MVELPEGPLSNPSMHLQEMARLLSKTPGWECVKTAMLVSWHNHGDETRLIEDGRAALREVGLGGTDLLRCIPDEYAALITDDEHSKASEGLELYMVASVANDIVHGEPLPLMAIAGGNVRVEYAEKDGVRFPVVHAYVTPLGDPVQKAEQFLATCYRTFGADTFAQHTKGSRDAEWFARMFNGETAREIAISDPRSGLAPEAAMMPDEYPEEVGTATEKVMKARQRFKSRWTRLADSMSTD